MHFIIEILQSAAIILTIAATIKCLYTQGTKLDILRDKYHEEKDRMDEFIKETFEVATTSRVGYRFMLGEHAILSHKYTLKKEAMPKPAKPAPKKKK